MMYYWEEKYENIWDYAPNPKRGRSRCEDRSALRCVCKEKSFTQQLNRFVRYFATITPPGVADVLRTYFKDEICCCAKNYCKHGDPPLPEDDMNDDLWELYTFFRNEFNTMDMLQLETDGSARQDAEGRDPEATETDLARETRRGDGRPASGSDVGEASDQENDTLLLSPYFKLKVMEMVMDCMKRKDIHRYYLLQHIRFLLHFHKVLTSNANADS